MIYAIEHGSEYYPSELIMVSDTLQICVDAVNNHENYPYMGDFIIVSVWEDNKKIAISETKGNREVELWDDATVEFITTPLTVEEIKEHWKTL